MKHIQILSNVLHVLPVAVAQSSLDGNAIHCTSGFVDYVMLSHNGANGP